MGKDAWAGVLLRVRITVEKPRKMIFEFFSKERLTAIVALFKVYPTLQLFDFQGRSNVASGDINGDGIDDVVTVAEQMGGPHVRAFDGKSGAELGNFFAFEEEFQGGVNLAVGDLNGDGKAEVVVGAGAGGAPRVRVFDPTTWTTLNGPLGDFYAFDAGQRGGVKVAVGDINSDGQRDLVTAPAAGNIGAARLYDGATGAMFWEALPFGPTTLNGVQVTDDIIDADAFETVPGNSLEEELRRHVVNDYLSDFPINFASATPLDQSEFNTAVLVTTPVIPEDVMCEMLKYVTQKYHEKLVELKNGLDAIQLGIIKMRAQIASDWVSQEKKDNAQLILNNLLQQQPISQAEYKALDALATAADQAYVALYFKPNPKPKPGNDNFD